MSNSQRYCYDKKTQETYEHLSVPFAIYQFVDKRVVTLVLSDGFCRLFGYEDRDKAYYDMDNDMYKEAHPDDIARIADAAYRFATEGGKYEVIYRSRQIGSSDYRIIHAYGEHVYTDTGVRLAHIWYSDEGVYMENAGKQGLGLNNSLSNALYENSSVSASRFDYLTGLPNMTHFFELAEAGNAEAAKKNIEYVMMYMDFSGMKFFNSKHGFAEGDKLLQAFAKILANTFGDSHSCRISADHFAVHTWKEELDDKIQQLISECGEMNGGKTLPLHIGIYVGKNESIHTSVACDRAKLACAALSGKYETAVNYYSQDLSDDAAKKQYVIENIDRAISEKWIQVYFQPIIRAISEQVCDVEALARWIDPEKGFMSPASFIPALEDAGLIYKLDLYMVDLILETLQKEKNDGITVIPHSINLSRSDFDVCDMVEEIRRRVDDAGISRDRLTIEITESVVGNNFEFIKEQVHRFRELGFPVWMDDFGSGYSSLNILQSVEFDLIKFDMSFMRRLDEGEKGRILLTELMRMATSLGFDTVCEGVETQEQVRFLREIGCSKLQGFYFSKPIPFETLMEMRKNNTVIKRENPEESEYYESIGRVNLFDLGVISTDEESAFNNVFNMIPIAILEITNGRATYVRSNRSYQDFAKQFFGVDIMKGQLILVGSDIRYGEGLNAVLRECYDTGNPAFFDEELSDGSIAHSFIRWIDKNPVTASVAVAIAVLSIRKSDESTTYQDIARALAADYYNIYIIDMDTDNYTEYSSKVGGEELSTERSGRDFFESAKADTMTRIHEDDREPFLAVFTKEKILEDLDSKGVFTTTYRLIDTGDPIYVNMKVTRMLGGNRIILGISIIDAHMKEKKYYEELQKERDMFIRIMALSDGYLSLYTVDPDTGYYVVYSSTEIYDSLGTARVGNDFFSQALIDVETRMYAPDKQRFKERFSKEKVLSEIREHGSFNINYRLLINDAPTPVSLKAAMFKDGDTDKLVIGVRAWKDREISED